MKLLIQFCFFLLLIAPTQALSRLPDQIEQDFSPVEGIVLMPVGDSFLVDLDATRNLQQGDLLAVLSAGERIIHPVTKDVLGTVDSVAGYLRVTRIMSGYSYAVVMSEGLSLQPGDRVRRFEQVPALLDPSIPASLAQELKQGLGHLQWVEQVTEDETPYLKFSMQNDRLDVSSSGGIVLSSYRFSSGQLLAPTVSVVRQTDTGGSTEPTRSLLNRGVDSVLGTVGLGGGDRRLEAPGIARQQDTDGAWMSPPLGDNPVGIAAADLIGDGQTEMAVALTNELRIMRFDNGQFTMVAQVGFPAGTRLLSIDALDLNQDGRHELYLTAVSGTDLRSQVVEYQNGEFRRTITMVNWFLRVLDLPEEGRVLVGQRMSIADNPFRPPVFRVLREGNRLLRGEDLALPEDINLFSLMPLVTATGEARYAMISGGDYLQVVDSEGMRLWRSSEHFGGSDTSFYNRPETAGAMPAPVTVQQRLLRLPSGEMLAVQNQGSRLLERLRTFSDSQIVAFDWDGSGLRERWRTPLRNGYIADVALADIDGDGAPELLLAMRFQVKNILQRGHSALVIHRLR